MLYQSSQCLDIFYFCKEGGFTVTDPIKKMLKTDTQTRYEIRLKGHLGKQWSEWFNGMTVILENNGNTLLIGWVVDQSELHGLLTKIRDLGMPLISLVDINSD